MLIANLIDSIITNKSPMDGGSTTTPQQLTPEQRKEELTKCILSQFRLCAAGTIGGAGFSVLRAQSGVRPTAWPMLGGAVSLNIVSYISLCVCVFVDCTVEDMTLF